MIVQDLKSRRVVLGTIYRKTGSAANKQLQALGPFIPLVGVTRIQLHWTHDIGIRSGLSANFFQPWYNKPVEIEITGESYMGMFGDTGIGDIVTKAGNNNQSQRDQIAQNQVKVDTQIKEANKQNFQDKIPSWLKSSVSGTVPSVINKIGATLAGGVTSIASSIQQMTQALAPQDDDGPSPHVDRTMGTLKKLISYFNYGPLQYGNSPYNKVTGKAPYNDVRHVLVLENEQGASGEKIPYSVFYGYVHDLEYSETIDHPFVYEFTFRFSGISQIADELQTILASVGRERSAFELTVTSSGILLREGLGI